jgi:HSP20 family protein
MREHPLERLQRDFDALFGNLWGGHIAPFARNLGSIRVWDFDVTENDREIVVRAELPGFEANELDVQINQDELTIKAEKEQKGDKQEEYRSFQRRITLPAGINVDQVQASYRNGVLELHIPRAEEAQPRRIQIQAEPGQKGSIASSKAPQREANPPAAPPSAPAKK